jgi:hypothetical protein
VELSNTLMALALHWHQVPQVQRHIARAIGAFLVRHVPLELVPPFVQQLVANAASANQIEQSLAFRVLAEAPEELGAKLPLPRAQAITACLKAHCEGVLRGLLAEHVLAHTQSVPLLFRCVQSWLELGVGTVNVSSFLGTPAVQLAWACCSPSTAYAAAWKEEAIDLLTSLVSVGAVDGSSSVTEGAGSIASALMSQFRFLAHLAGHSEEVEEASMGATVVVTAAADKFAPFYATAAVHQSPDLDWRFGFLDFILAITTTAPFKICELALPFWERLSEPSGASASASVVPAAQLDPTVQQALLRASDIVSRRTAYPASYHAWPEGRRADFIEFRDSVRQTLRKLVATVGVSRSDCRVRFGSAPLDGHSAREGGLPASQLCESSTRQSAPAPSRRLLP